MVGLGVAVGAAIPLFHPHRRPMTPFDDFLAAQLARIQSLPLRPPLQTRERRYLRRAYRKRVHRLELAHEAYEADRMLLGGRAMAAECEVRR